MDQKFRALVALAENPALFSSISMVTYNCGGLDENAPLRLMYLNSWFPVGGTVWEGLGGVLWDNSHVPCKDLSLVLV